MIYLIAILLVVVIVTNNVAITFVVKSAREERQALEDQLIAVCKPEAVSLVQTREPAEVTYVDEQREWELSPSGGGMGDLEP